jgi:hypothetical protein
VLLSHVLEFWSLFCFVFFCFDLFFKPFFLWFLERTSPAFYVDWIFLLKFLTTTILLMVFKIWIMKTIIDTHCLKDLKPFVTESWFLSVKLSCSMVIQKLHKYRSCCEFKTLKTPLQYSPLLCPPPPFKRAPPYLHQT